MKELTGAVSRRLGAGVAAYLVAKLGIPAEAAQQIVIALGVTAGLVIDAAVVALLARLR